MKKLKLISRKSIPVGGFPVNLMRSSDCMVQYQSVSNTWKNLVGGLYDTFNKRKSSLKTMRDFSTT